MGTATFTEVLGLVTRIWDSVVDPNYLSVAPHNGTLRVTLRVYDLEVPETERSNSASAKDLVFDVGNETFGVRRLLFG